MRYSLMFEGQEGVTWDEWLAAAAACERLGFEGLFSSDHYFPTKGSTDRGSSDAWTVLAALAARTERIRLGTLVSPVTFRHPAHLAKVAEEGDGEDRAATARIAASPASRAFSLVVALGLIVLAFGAVAVFAIVR